MQSEHRRATRIVVQTELPKLLGNRCCWATNDRNDDDATGSDVAFFLTEMGITSHIVADLAVSVE